ncbi:MAG: single-stranded-DNA-specific exonuclease RecJ [Clostridia bacterium]
MIEKEWVSKTVTDEEISKLSNEASISNILARVFLNRGMSEPLHVSKFLNPQISDIYDPFLLKDMDIVVERLVKAINEKQMITIYGDYDVDGITSTSVLYNFLLRIGGNADYFIPDRNIEGYGLSINSLKNIIKKGTKLIVTVDCGVTAFEEVEYVNENGAEIIITDHHRCIDKLPNAYAIINSCRNDCNYPFKNLAGVGVVYKIITAICIEMELGEIYNDYLDLVALGTVADVVPLIDENRIIVKNGLDLIRNTKNVGLKTMISECNITNKAVSTYNIAYIIAPRINAAGRIGDASRAVRLFGTDDEAEAKKIVGILTEENKFRQDTEMKILSDAIDIIESDSSYNEKKVIIVSKEGWHHGIIGIVASRIKEKYYKPCILISFENGIGKGSGRSIEGFNLFDALSDSSDLLINFGGHELAAGLSLDKKNIREFDEKINLYAAKKIDKAVFTPKIKFDTVINKEEITLNNVNELEKLSPYGAGNPSPVFSSDKFIISGIRNVGENRHLKIVLKHNDFIVDSIGFNLGEYIDEFSENDIVDAIFGMEINSWNSSKKLQLNLKDIHINGQEISEKLYYLSLNHFIDEYIKGEISQDNHNKDPNVLAKTISFNEFLKRSNKNKKTAVLINCIESFKEIRKGIENEEITINKTIKICYTECSKAESDKLIVLVNPDYKKIKKDTFDEIAIFDSWVDCNFIIGALNEKRIANVHFISDSTSKETCLKDILIERDDLVSIFQYIKSKNENPIIIKDIFEFTGEISKSYKIRLNIFKLIKSIEIFKELDILDFKKTGSNSMEVVLKNENGRKVNLENSNILKKIRGLKK